MNIRIFLAAIMLAAMAVVPCRAQIPNDSALIPGLSLDRIQPTYGEGYFWPRHMHELGWQWNLHRMLMPMAWQITRGRPEIVIAAHDAWYPDVNVYHPDVIPKPSLSDTGNFIVIGDSTVKGDGHIYSEKVGYDHGLGVIGMAIANGDIDDEGPGGGMIGVCPGCSGAGVESSANIAQLDTDMEQNDTLRRVAVLNISLASDERDHFTPDDYRIAIDSGIVVVSAIRNDRKNFLYADTIIYFDTARGEEVVAMHPLSDYPSFPCLDRFERSEQGLRSD